MSTVTVAILQAQAGHNPPGWFARLRAVAGTMPSMPAYGHSCSEISSFWKITRHIGRPWASGVMHLG